MSGTVEYCDCYGDPEGSPLCDECNECKAEEREQDAERAADLYAEDERLYFVPSNPPSEGVA